MGLGNLGVVSLKSCDFRQIQKTCHVWVGIQHGGTFQRRSIFAFGAMCYDAFPWDFWLQKDMSRNLAGSRVKSVVACFTATVRLSRTVVRSYTDASSLLLSLQDLSIIHLHHLSLYEFLVLLSSSMFLWNPCRFQMFHVPAFAEGARSHLGRDQHQRRWAAVGFIKNRDLLP